MWPYWNDQYQKICPPGPFWEFKLKYIELDNLYKYLELDIKYNIVSGPGQAGLQLLQQSDSNKLSVRVKSLSSTRIQPFPCLSMRFLGGNSSFFESIVSIV